MDSLAGQRVEIHRQRGDQRLAFAGFHLGDIAFVQNHAADQLHVEVPLAEGTLGRLAHGGEGRDQQVVKALSSRDLLAEFGGAGLQRFIGQRDEFRFEGVDGVDAGLVGLDTPVIGGAEKLAGERADHKEFPVFSVRRCGHDVIHQVVYQLAPINSS